MGTKPSGHSSYRQAAEAARRVVNGHWEIAVLTALALGPLHTYELVIAVNSVEETVGRREHNKPLSRQQLARTLDRLETDGLLIRHDETVTHPSVRYELTEKGYGLLKALRPLAKWAERYQNEPGRST